MGVLAQEKADQVLKLIGFPDWISSYAEVDDYYVYAPESKEDDHFGNMLGMRSFYATEDLRTLRENPQRDTWPLSPVVVNAWYDFQKNTMTFPEGFLQPPAYKRGFPRFINYGAINIGHELTHGFDSFGRQYDGQGNASPWWSNSTVDGYIERSQCFIEQYNNYTVPELEGVMQEGENHVNGVGTLAENIADNGGIRASYRAYLNSLEEEGPDVTLPGMENYTSQQLFFVAFGQLWCEKTTQEFLLQWILSDNHSPGKFRVNGPMSNTDGFQEAFSCPKDSAMNRPDKCRLW